MSKFLFTYTGGMTPEAATPAQRKQSMDEWMAWFGMMGKAVVEMGAPTKPGKSVGRGGARSLGASGVTGYTFIKADNLDSAIGLAKSCPVIKEGGKVIVSEVIPM